MNPKNGKHLYRAQWGPTPGRLARWWARLTGNEQTFGDMQAADNGDWITVQYAPGRQTIRSHRKVIEGGVAYEEVVDTTDGAETVVAKFKYDDLKAAP